MDGWTDGQTDERMDGRTYTHPKSDLSPIPKLILLPIDAISIEKNARTDRVKPIRPSDYRQAGHKKSLVPQALAYYNDFL